MCIKGIKCIKRIKDMKSINYIQQPSLAVAAALLRAGDALLAGSEPA
jgi:hypothetical protein